ncbi:hypothetical protein B484DRAFT_439334, partial [Ochromonadaceae sp. CCMP2298]
TPNLRGEGWGEGLESSSPATAGSAGVTYLPVCPAGYGNNVAAGSVCNICRIGTYSVGNSAGECISCTNAPEHSYYIDTGETSAQCLFQCDDSFVTVHCYNQIQNFIYNVLGVGGTTGLLVALFVAILGPLIYFRLKRAYGWYDDDKRTDIFGGLFMHDETPLEKRPVASPTINPLSPSISEPHPESQRIRQPKRLQRQEHRLLDQDLIFHSCRINLLGANHPWMMHGGAWHMPEQRPVSLRPTLRRAEYRALAERVNSSLGWEPLGVEMLAYYLTAIVAPPLAAHLMTMFSKRRAALLLRIVAKYDYACFRSPKQRKECSSLRVGISPCATLAYMDILFDEESYGDRMLPLGTLGQMKLPACFKLAGLGTYSTPYYVDTNDLLLQAVPQTDIPSSFINDAWIAFIVELNKTLRTVQSDSLHLGLYELVRFLSSEKSTAQLGGVVVQFCTLSNTQPSYASELKGA